MILYEKDMYHNGISINFGIFTYYIKVAVLVMIDNDSAGRESLLL